MYEFPPMAARIAILVCLYLFLFAAYRELYRTVKETRPLVQGPDADPARPRALPTLTVVQTPDDSAVVAGDTIPLLTSNTIGRAGDSTIVLQDASVSVSHARVDFMDGGFVLTDAGSTNGTYVNGARVTGRAELRPGDYVQVGGVVMEFRA